MFTWLMKTITSFSNAGEDVNSAPVLVFNLQNLMVADQEIIDVIAVRYCRVEELWSI